MGIVMRLSTWLAALAVAIPISGGVVHAATNSSATADWYGHGHHTDAIGDLVERVVTGTAGQTSPATNQGTPCTAEQSTSGNVQVNCRAEDGTSPQNTQSETSVAAVSQKV